MTVCSAKNSGVQRLAVTSQATALPPFSQNSNDEVCLGSGQAQPGQSKPCGWFHASQCRCTFHRDPLYQQGVAERLERPPSAGRLAIGTNRFAGHLRSLLVHDPCCQLGSSREHRLFKSDFAFRDRTSTATTIDGVRSGQRLDSAFRKKRRPSRKPAMHGAYRLIKEPAAMSARLVSTTFQEQLTNMFSRRGFAGSFGGRARPRSAPGRNSHGWQPGRAGSRSH